MAKGLWRRYRLCTIFFAVFSNARCLSVANIRCQPCAVSDITFLSARKHPSGINGRKSPAVRKIMVSIFFKYTINVKLPMSNSISNVFWGGWADVSLCGQLYARWLALEGHVQDLFQSASRLSAEWLEPWGVNVCFYVTLHLLNDFCV